MHKVHEMNYAQSVRLIKVTNAPKYTLTTITFRDIMDVE